MINHKIKPLVTAYGYEKDSSSMVFITPGKEVKIKNCNEPLKKILPLCDGLTDLEEIKKVLSKKIKSQSINKLISVLFKNCILIDSTEYYEIFHKVSSNPMTFYHTLNQPQLKKIFVELGSKNITKKNKRIPLEIKHTPFMEILEKRKSTRIFSSKKNISFQKFSGLIWSTYGRLKKPLKDFVGTGPAYNIPSGGRLYSIEQYFVLLKKVGCLKEGLYYYDRDLGECIKLKPGPLASNVAQCFGGSKQFKNAVLVQIITSRIKRASQKYANRAYRNILLEAGHSAQNAYIYCAENNLGIVEYGGFCDEKLAKFLGIKFSEEIPLILMIIGAKD